MGVKAKIENNTTELNDINEKLTAINSFVRPLSEFVNDVDLEKCTAGASDVVSGKKVYTRSGFITGTHNCSGAVTSQSKVITPTQVSQVVAPDSNYNYLQQVTVNPIPSEYVIPTGNLDITANGVYDTMDKACVTVNISGISSSISFDSTTGTLTILE